MVSIAFQSLGGLGLFLLGMKIMSEGLQKFAGRRMRRILSKVSNNRFIGCAAGTFVTGIIQSSSATTVMLVGFVDSGLMTLTQAAGVALGANIGTTVTAQIIAFEIYDYALPAIAAGVFLKFFVGSRRWNYTGDVLVGFGLIFYGLFLVKSGIDPLKTNETFISLFSRFQADTFNGLISCIITGSVLSMILQSSSVTIGIIMVLAGQGLLNFVNSAALVLGTEIGTTITAQIAALGANVNAHRTATFHSFVNVAGVFIVVLFFPFFTKFAQWITSFLTGAGPPDLIIEGAKPNMARHIANFQTTFNVMTAVFFLMILPYVVKAATWLTPRLKGEDGLDELHHIKYIDFKYIEVPSMAFTQARAEICRMGEAVRIMYNDVMRSLQDRKLTELLKWKNREEALDILQREITHFLVRTMQGEINDEESKDVRSLIRMVNNLERIGDATEEIATLIAELVERNLYMSEEAVQDFEMISDANRQFLIMVLDKMKNEDKEIMTRAREFVVNIHVMEEDMKAGHLLRLQKGICEVDTGLIFVNMLTSFEKMGGYCYNIAEAVAGLK